jgi:hypothetical protein
MRTVTHLLLILFVSFLAAPTIVSVINKSCDTSYFYSISEEELTHKAVKEFKMQITNDNSFKLVTLSLSIITSENQLKHDNITPSIFSPPPNA